MKTQYTKGKLEAFPFQDGAISLVIGQDQIADMVNEYEGDLQHNNAQLICSSVNIIQQLADSLGVNAVELAQRMEEGGLLLEALEYMRLAQGRLCAGHGDEWIKDDDLVNRGFRILSKLEGRQG